MAESGLPPLHELTPRAAREAGARMAELYGRGPEMARVADVELGRLFVPNGRARGVIVYYHGGGWVLGTPDQFDALARRLAAGTGCAVVLVDYRLAPEHRYPTAVEDAWTALEWTAANVEQIAGGPVPLIVAGDSAGGCLAAVVAQRAREAGPEIALQVLVYPVTDCDLDADSYLDPANQLIVGRDTMAWFWDHYAPDASVRTSPDASPLRADTLAGLPPAVVLTAEHDPLRDEGEAYAERLAQDGVRVEHRRFDGQMHGFFMMGDILPGSAAGLDFVVQAIDRELAPIELDAIVVGAGFAGLYALHRLRGLGLSVRVLEQGEAIGGTWYWNRYPGARCDIESMDYSYSFSDELEQEWEWTERYPTQPEILRYLNHVADRFDLRRDIELSTRVVQARYVDELGKWDVATEDGRRYSATYCIMASGCLSSLHRPAIDGLDDFQGDWYHTARWPHDGVELAGKRVCVIGTGSTGIQLIPQVAKQAEHLYVFQRTANFSMPARNRPLDPDLQRAIKADYRERRRLSRESLSGAPVSHPDVLPQRSALEVTPEERKRAYERGWAQGGIGGITLAFNDINVNAEANATAADFVRDKIRSIVRDPATAEALCPTSHPVGTKRICVDIDYYETYNRDNVTLVDVRSAPIVRLTARGIETASAEYELDVIVFATGFDAMTGALLDIDIRGRGGRLADGQVVRRAAHLSRARDRRISQPVPRHRPGKPLGAEQHGAVDRAARRLDRGLHRPPPGARARHDRGDARRRGRLGGARERGRRRDAVPAGQLLVRRREHTGQAAGVHAVPRRRRQLPEPLRRRRRRRLRGVRDDGGGSVSASTAEHARPYIGGEWVERPGGRLVDVVNPTTEEPIGRAQLAGPSDIDRAVRAARAAFDGGPWAASTVSERAAIMSRAGELIAERAARLTQTITLEVGSPLAIAGWQPVAAKLYLDWHAAQASTFPWEEERDGIRGPLLVRRPPVGVVGAIVPWNFPVALSFPKLAPALLTGCSVVLKPPEETPLFGSLLAEVFEEAGLPPGVLNVVPADRARERGAGQAPAGRQDQLHREHARRAPDRRAVRGADQALQPRARRQVRRDRAAGRGSRRRDR